MVTHVNKRRRWMREREKRFPEVVEVQLAIKKSGLEVIKDQLARDGRGGLEIRTNGVRGMEREKEQRNNLYNHHLQIREPLRNELDCTCAIVLHSCTSNLGKS